MAKMRAVQVSRPNGPLEIVERSIPSPAPDRCALRSRPVESVTAIRSPKKDFFGDSVPAHSRARGRRNYRCQSDRASRRGGSLASVSAWAGTAGTVAIAMPADGEISSPARRAAQITASRMTVAMPIT